MKNTYIIKEAQNLQSNREGFTYTGTLTAAKKMASRSQIFYSTTLKIELNNDALVAYKEPLQDWITIDL